MTVIVGGEKKLRPSIGSIRKTGTTSTNTFSGNKCRNVAENVDWCTNKNSIEHFTMAFFNTRNVYRRNICQKDLQVPKIKIYSILISTKRSLIYAGNTRLDIWRPGNVAADTCFKATHFFWLCRKNKFTGMHEHGCTQVAFRRYSSGFQTIEIT